MAGQAPESLSLLALLVTNTAKEDAWEQYSSSLEAKRTLVMLASFSLVGIARVLGYEDIAEA